MTVASETNVAGPYSCNGSTTEFTIPFLYFETTDIVVYLIDTTDDSETTLTEDVDYTVSTPGSSGTVTTTLAYSSLYQVRIQREVPYTQDTDLQNQATFFPEVLEAALDKLTMMCQQIHTQFLDIEELYTDDIANINASIAAAAASAADAAAAETAAETAQGLAEVAQAAAEAAAEAATAAAGVGPVLISANDTTTGYVNGKLVAGGGISFTENNDGANETLTISTSETFILACSDETSDLTAGTAKVKFRMPFALTVTSVGASLSTAATGTTLTTVDINESGTSILSTKITLDASETTSATAATAAVISDPAIASGAEISVDIDAVGSTTPGAGLKVWIIGVKA